MIKRPCITSQTLVYVAESEPQFVDQYDDGRVVILLSPLGEFTSVDLIGTPDELHWLCDKLRAIVTAHESQTTLAGEAAREVAAEANAS